MLFFLVIFAIISLSLAVDKVCDCSTPNCAIIPPAGVDFPCYQGAPSDATKCYNTDPLFKTGTTWSCGNCTSFGYLTYLKNDPVYKSMELWGK